MSILGRLMDTMRLPGAEEDYDDDYFLDEEEEDERPAKKNLFSKRNDDYYEDEDDYDSKPRFLSRSSKVVPIKRGMEVSLVKPNSIEDSREISDYLLSGKAVVLNMEGITMELAQRIIDFTSGATYSMNGNLQKISNYIFIATPESVELSGDFQELLSSQTVDLPELNIRL